MKVYQKKLSIQQNVLWNSLGSSVYWGCSWLTTILVVWLGNYELAGILSLAMAISSTIYCISAYGVYNFQVSDLKNEYTSNNYMSMRIVSAVIGFIIAIVICIFQQYDSYQCKCILMYMMYKTVECFVNVIQAEEQKANRMDLIGKAYILRGVGTLIIFIVGMSCTQNLFFTLSAMTIYSAIIYILYDLNNVHELLGRKYHLSGSNVRRLLITCLPMALYWLFNTLTPTIPKLIIERIMGAEVLGIYASISSPLLVISMAANFILTPLISPLSSHYHLNKAVKMKRSISEIMGVIVMCGIICFIGGKILTEPVLRILYGDSIVLYVDIAQGIIVAVVFSVMISFLNILLTIFRELWLLVIVNGGTSILAWVLCQLSISKYGLQGANYALVTVYLIQIVIMLLLFFIKYNKWIKNIEEK